MGEFWHWDDLYQFLAVVSAALAAFIILFVIKRLTLRRLYHWSGIKPAWYSDLLDALHHPVNLAIFAIAIEVGTSLAPETAPGVKTAQSAGKVLLILSLFWLVDRLALVAIRKGGANKLSETTRTLFSTIARLIFIVLTVLIILDSLGISITPILASLGIGSVAVALALQDTLSNFFSGVYVMVDKPIRVGDMVRIEDGTEGLVKKIGWRSTHIETLSTNTVVIPNSKLAGSVITNYDMPTSQVFLRIPIGVSYDSDLEKVETETIRAAREHLSKTPGGVKDVDPVIRYTEFSDSSINFNLIVRVQNYVDTFVVRHEMIKAIHAHYSRAGIEIPFPQRTVRVVQWPTEQANRSSAMPS